MDLLEQQGLDTHLFELGLTTKGCKHRKVDNLGSMPNVQ